LRRYKENWIWGPPFDAQSKDKEQIFERRLKVIGAITGSLGLLISLINFAWIIFRFEFDSQQGHRDIVARNRLNEKRAFYLGTYVAGMDYDAYQHMVSPDQAKVDLGEWNRNYARARVALSQLGLQSDFRPSTDVDYANATEILGEAIHDMLSSGVNRAFWQGFRIRSDVLYSRGGFFDDRGWKDLKSQISTHILPDLQKVRHTIGANIERATMESERVAKSSKMDSDAAHNLYSAILDVQEAVSKQFDQP